MIAELLVVCLAKLTFVAAKPLPPQVAYQELLMAAEIGAEYFS